MNHRYVSNQSNVLIGLLVIAAAMFTFAVEANEKPIFSIENCKNSTSIQFSLAELQALDSNTITTSLPWEKQKKSYTGVYLHKLISIVNASNYNGIHIAAKNQYGAFIANEELNKHSYMLAYAVDGRGIKRRQKGPLILIRDLNDIAEEDMNNLDIVINLVWFVDKISIHSGPIN